MRLIVKELVLLFLTIVQARYIGYQGHGGHGGYGNDYYYQSLDHYGPSNPFGSSSAGLALNPHYAYSKAAYQDYKYQQVKYAPYRSAPEFDFGHDENKGKHYCPTDRPNYIRDDSFRGVRNECVGTTFCGFTAYNPRDEGCCPLLGQHFNFNTYQCESCPADGAPVASFNPSTQQCCPGDTPFYLRESNECLSGIVGCSLTAYIPGEEACCSSPNQFINPQTNQCEDCGEFIPFNPFTQQCCPADRPSVGTNPFNPTTYRQCFS